MDNFPIIGIVDSVQGSYVLNPDIETRCVRGQAHVQLVHLSSEQELSVYGNAFDVLVNWHRIPLSRQVISSLAKCKGIVRAAVGFDNIDIHFAASRGIPVANVPDYGTEEVADHTFALLLAVARGIVGGAQEVKSYGWDWNYDLKRIRLRGRKLGIIGLGRIGTAVALRAKSFGLDISFYDPYIPSGVEKVLGIQRFESLDTLFAQSQIISLHTPLTSETIGMVGARELELMPVDSIIINTSRGEILQLDALRSALQQGHILGAGLDVIEGEPSVPLWITDNPKIVVTPHSAFYSQESLAELRKRSIEIALMFLKGETPREIVNSNKCVAL